MNLPGTPQGLFGLVVLACLPEFGRRDEGVSRGQALSFHRYDSWLLKVAGSAPAHVAATVSSWPACRLPGSPILLRIVGREANGGAVGRDRTFDARIFGPALYRLSYNGVLSSRYELIVIDTGAGCENRTRLRRLGRPTDRLDQPALNGGCPRIRTAKASDKRFTVSPRYRYGTRHPKIWLRGIDKLA